MSVAHANRTNFMLRLKLIHKKSQFFLSKKKKKEKEMKFYYSCVLV